MLDKQKDVLALKIISGETKLFRAVVQIYKRVVLIFGTWATLKKTVGSGEVADLLS